MIIFLNFAPITFMGGAEKWMNDTAGRVHKYEDSLLVSVAPSIANVYGKLVLKREFVDRTGERKIHDNVSLGLFNFLPFTNEWKKTREKFRSSRLIYAKYELLELLIVSYFGGLSGIKKTVAGIHSPFLYANPTGFLDRVHNNVYRSSMSKRILSDVKKIHVLNLRDKKIMQDDLKLQHLAYVPNGIQSQKNKILKETNPDKLFVLFVGELSARKGVDLLFKIIRQSPKHFIFTIAGDGPMAKDVRKFALKNPRCIYKGFLHEEWLKELYETHDVLVLPSRAESMSLATLEALSYGLVIVNSKETNLSLEKGIEYSCDNKNIKSYEEAFEDIYKRKKMELIKKEKIREYFHKSFSTEIIYPKLFGSVFGIRK